MRPRILVTETKLQGLRSLDELRAAVRHGHARKLWQELLEKVERERTEAPLTPDAMFPGRDRDQARHANRDYTVVQAASDRVMSAALAALVTGNVRYRDAALEQMDALFDETRWPEWRDLAHPWVTADLRTGRLSMSLALAYDWLYQSLTDSQRKCVIDGIHRCGVKRYLQSVAENAWWLTRRTNWMTCVVGGLGMAGMAMGEDHPESQRLLDLSFGRMSDYLAVYGPAGEFNESVSYAGSTQAPVLYFSAYRYFTQGGENLLARHPFPATCAWYMHFCFPPGWIADFGDTSVGAQPTTAHVAAVAAAARDGILQWFYLNYPRRADATSLALELLWYDPSLEPVSPEGKLPHGRAFPAHGGLVSSRADWNPRSTAGVVVSKAGHGSEVHGNHDAGQVCIEGYGQKLIVDLGSPSLYPTDFFGPNRYQYYNASVFGHNVLMFDGQEMAVGEARRAEIVPSGFDDKKGISWLIDLTGVYDGVLSVQRFVVHHPPRIVAVLDEAKLPRPREISLRWHTADRAEPDESGCFVVQAGEVSLAAKMAELDGRDIVFRRREHEYRPPFDRGRLGDPLEQRHESFVEATLKAETCRILTLFAIFGPGEPVSEWHPTDGGLGIEFPGSDRPFRWLTDGLKSMIGRLQTLGG